MAEEKERLFKTVNSYISTINESMQIFNQPPALSVQKVQWREVINLGDEFSKQASLVGVLCFGGTPEVRVMEDVIGHFFTTLRSFLFLSHASTVGSGPTLFANIHESVMQIVHCSFELVNYTVSTYGTDNINVKVSGLKLVDEVAEACTALTKIPTTNVLAIGKAMTQLSRSVKNVLGQIKDLKSGFSNERDDAFDEAESELSERDGSGDATLGKDLLPEEMKIAELAIGLLSELLLFIKELVNAIMGLLQQERTNNEINFVESLEKLLKLCKEIIGLVEELGPFLSPPQEFSAMKATLEKMSGIIGEVQSGVESLGSSSEGFIQACNGLRSSMNQMESELDCSISAYLANRIPNVSTSK